ncbi:hypothetical protein HOD75_00695 [archaeon]|jgi:hypothetical protein|nr:hypothetical protein [archaeon]MBT4241394.1 hypothetical protein [archaeon]MBT4418215.1 hypothetical protein [archaeon]
MKKRNNILDIFMWILIYIGAIIIIGWYLLKILGIINTPIWIEALPYFGGGLSIAGGAYQLGRILKGIEITNRKVNNIGNKLISFEDRFNRVEHTQELCVKGKLNKSPYE